MNPLDPDELRAGQEAGLNAALAGAARRDLLEAAAVRCFCGRATVRVEQSWTRDDAGGWRPAKWAAVCPDNHRTPIKPL